MYRLHHLLTFQAVHRTGSFAIAARQLGYTPSAVSQQIAILEKDTGLVLFEREAHGIRATGVADQLLELSRNVLASVDEFSDQVRRLATGTSGRLRIGSFPTAGVRLAPKLLSMFTEQYPNVEITLTEGEPDELLEPLVDGELDVAMVYEYGLCPRQWPTMLATETLVQEDLILLRPGEEHLDVALSELNDRRWITSNEDTAGARSLARLCATAGFDPTIAFRSNNYDVVRELVAATGGVAIVPALGHVPDERILATPMRDRSAYRTVLAVSRAGNSGPLLQALLTLAHQAVPAGAEHLRPR